jgi:hypothetical protein
MKLKKGIPLIDQHDQHGFWGGKFGGSFIPETLKKPVEDLTNEFKKLRKDKKFLKKRDFYFKNYIGTPTSFVKLDNLTNHLGGAQIWAKVVLRLMEVHIKYIMQLSMLLFVKQWVRNISLVIQELVMQEKCLVWLLKNLALNVKYLWGQKILKDKNLTVMQ